MSSYRGSCAWSRRAARWFGLPGTDIRTLGAKKWAADDSKTRAAPQDRPWFGRAGSYPTRARRRLGTRYLRPIESLAPAAEPFYNAASNSPRTPGGRLVPAVYDKLGIRFLYPDNWTIDEQEALEGNRSVAVYSPGGAFWSIALHAPDTDPEQLAATALATLQEEYAEAEFEPVVEEVEDYQLTGYDLNFFYLDLTNTALIRGFRTGDATCLVLCQAEDREYEQVEPVFRAITTSLLAEAAAP